MSRRRAAQKRDILPDPKYKSKKLAKFINVLMKDGKKSVARNIVYKALENVVTHVKKQGLKTDGAEKNSSAIAIERAGHPDTCEIARALALSKFNEALANITPRLEVKSKRVGGATFQVPVEVSVNRQQALAMRWMIEFSRKRNEKDMEKKLSSELLAAIAKQGGAYKKMEDTLRMADANKAFAHYR